MDHIISSASSDTAPVRPGIRQRARISELDGVRGLAISAVFLYHAVRGLPHVRPHEHLIHAVANAGWIGVDLFFVLSGFLITRILLDAKGQAAYFRNFYSRRVLRIVPRSI